MARRDENLTSKLLDALKRGGRPLTSLELAKAVGLQTRKEVNPTLYSLQSQGKVRKVRDSPPLWGLPPAGRSSSSGSAHAPQTVGRGRARPFRVATPPGNMLTPSLTLSPTLGATSSATSTAYQDHRSSVNTSHVASGDLKSRIVAALTQSNQPQTALELAHTLGFEKRSDVNPQLYAMEKEGLVYKVEGQGPPKWCARQSRLAFGPVVQSRPAVGSPLVLEATPQSSISDQSAVNVVCEGLQQLSSQLHHTSSNSSANGEEAMESEVASDDDEMDTDSKQRPPLVDLSHIPEENIRERLLTVLRADPHTSKTDLELAKAIGGSYTRSDVRPQMEMLAREGLAKKSEGFPARWSPAAGNQVATSGRLDLLPSQQLSPQVAFGGTGSMPQLTQPCGTSGAISEALTNMNRNPVSALSEYCQAKKLELNFTEVRAFGPPHRKHFVIAAVFGDMSFEAESTNKKEAKRMAADLALQSIMAKQIHVQFPTSPSPAVSTYINPGVNIPSSANSFSDQIARLSHDFYHQLQSTVEVPQPGRKVIACFIMEDRVTGELKVVSVGSGTRCITGDKMSLEGLVVNDSHAEVVARRSLLRFFYWQLMALFQGSQGTIFTKSSEDSMKATVKDKFRFHLYISTAPCGDGAQFSRGDELNRDPPTDGNHQPTMLTKAQGVLRTKMEGGEGTIPIADDVQPQTWDGILQGGRLRTMSCSDKVGRWNVVGLQGALLSHFMAPVYMSSLTLGSLHHHGHLSRAVCCRFNELKGDLPLGYTINHPSLGRVQGGDEMKRHTEKTNNFSMNWALGDSIAELNNGTNGKPVLPPGIPKSQHGTSCSRICKAHLFSLFLSLSAMSNRTDLQAKMYKDAKEAAEDFQHAKRALYQLCEKKSFGMWMKKPVEQEQFDSSILRLLNLET